MKHFKTVDVSHLKRSVWLLAVMAFLGVRSVHAQVNVTVSPQSGTTGVSPSAVVVFTFDEPMDETTVSIAFYSLNPPGIFTTVNTWNGASTQLTCTPSPNFPSDAFISWQLSGDSDTGDFADEAGQFRTGSGTGGGGTGTNAFTSFSLGKVHDYNQYSTAAPTLDTNAPYLFSATTMLASNRTATAITLTLPTAAVSNLDNTFTQPENYILYYFTSVSNQLESTFPQGAYQFFVSSSQSNQTVGMSMPVTMAQPSVPHISNFTAAQSVNPSQPFTLTWDAFVGGTSTNFVSVVVGNWKSPDAGTAGALAGTATSVIIPAGALTANSNYDAQIGFYRSLSTSNATFRTIAYRATVTQFNLHTVGSSTPLPVLSHPSWSGGLFGFDVTTTAGQTLTAIYSTNASLPQAQWQILTTTVSPGTTIRITDPHSISNRAGFYRVRNGT